ncbi:MAG: hypothetical protein NZ602_03680 [Thermoguttaceae bacterium]|nr:hypothetical protein [Thermoguttaceae bacterium]MDW8037827.1 hypothetical protein [Thermoguttaceae bacterium]
MKSPGTLALGFLALLLSTTITLGGVPPGYSAAYEQGNFPTQPVIGAGAGGAASKELPQPIVTRQTVFAIPFHLVPAQDSSQQAVEVHLYVSTDQGRRWQLYQRVRPTEGQFLVRTTGEGEYWFLVRTVDRAGRVRPQGPPQPEMRVVVDTTPPHLSLTAEPSPSGSVTVRWKMTDRTLRPETLRITYRSSPDGPWQPVGLEAQQVQTVSEGQEGWTSWNPPVGIVGAELRAEVADAAGNLAVAHAQVQLPFLAGGASLNPPSNLLQDQWRASRREGPSQPLLPDPPGASSVLPTQPSSPVWASLVPGSSNATSPPAGSVPTSSLAAGNPAVGPIYPPVQSQFSGTASQSQSAASGGSTGSGADRPAGSAGSGASSAGSGSSSVPSASAASAQSDSGSPTGASTARASTGTDPQPKQATSTGQPNSPSAKPTPSASTPSERSAKLANPPAQAAGVAPKQTSSSSQPSDTPMGVGAQAGSVRMVNSRIFELEYELGGPMVPGRVELWATRDGGRTWQCWGPDTDGRSPMIVSVPEEGIYGFRVLVSADPRTPTSGPQPGELPDVWIGADWTRPTGRIIAVEPIQADQDPQLLIRWEASDRYLADRPISLFYSPTGAMGSWTPIATSLQNTGQYLWKVPAHIPDRVYIQLEIRDQAGNLTVDQTRQSIPIGVGRERAKIRDVRPVQPGSKAFLPSRLG